ncbi:MAG: hypothetical protein AB8F74_01075 [Saprospiraceae bacterium]
MEETPRKTSLVGPLELIMLILGLGIIAYIMLQDGDGGGKLMERTETIKILDNPSGSKEKARRYEPENEESVEALLQNLAEQFSEEEKNAGKSKSSQAKPTYGKSADQLSKDEKKYYEDVRQKASIQDRIETARDWYRILSASQKTYAQVKDIFGETARLPEDKVNAENVNKELEKQGASDDFYKKLSESFQIDPEDVKAFGRTGKRALSDWAEFVQQESKD